ncbi:hypothetical protein EV175_004953 [Coemansia sp. RSA 1933]|nr:hypothetical protein EV175_004953 [Coemansia sp. RSA 1933]
MREIWSNSVAKKASISVDLFTPQVTVTSGSETNLLLGYVDIDLERATEIKYIKVALSGTYSAFWNDGVGQARNEFYQNKLFHHECIMLTRHHLQQEEKEGWRDLKAADMVEGTMPLELCVRKADRDWEAVSLESGSDSDDADDAAWSAPTSPPPPFAPSLSGPAWARRQYRGDMDGSAEADEGGFTLPGGRHRFRFNMRLPARMPSTIASAVGGGIEYALCARLKTRGALGLPAHSTARCPVRVVNLPSRFAELQASLPVNDEAIFTRQIDNAWWVLARLSSCTVSPLDALLLSVTLAWPEYCAFSSDVSRFVQIAAVHMDLYEHTTYRSLASGTVIKKIKVPVVSSISGAGEKALPPSPTSPTSTLASDAAHVSTRTSKDGRAAAAEGHIRAMFNEDHRRVFQLRVPVQREDKDAKGVHIDCRSVPICVSHELHMSVQIIDKVAQKMHLVPFHSRVIVVPEAEAFYLPAYTSSRLDARVL